MSANSSVLLHPLWQVCRLGLAGLLLLALNGCAALAVSLAGAGAGATLSHQMNGTASRTFSDSFDKVDAAVRVASKRLFLEVKDVSSQGGVQVTTARVSNLDVSLELESLSPTLTRVNVVARKDLFRVDGATAQEIVAQVEKALGGINAVEGDTLANGNRDGRIDDARYLRTDPPTSKKPGSSKKKTSI